VPLLEDSLKEKKPAETKTQLSDVCCATRCQAAAASSVEPAIEPLTACTVKQTYLSGSTRCTVSDIYPACLSLLNSNSLTKVHKRTMTLTH
jgi:hypothetical protein